METLHLTATVGADGDLHIVARTTLPPGPTEVVLVLGQAQRSGTTSLADRLRAAEELCAMELPVADVQQMNRESTPSEEELIR
jgi:hypothetical protein